MSAPAPAPARTPMAAAPAPAAAPVQAQMEAAAEVLPQKKPRRKRSFTRMILGDTFVDEPALSKASAAAASFDQETEALSDSMVGAIVASRTSIPWPLIIIGTALLSAIVAGLVLISGADDETAPSEDAAGAAAPEE